MKKLSRELLLLEGSGLSGNSCSASESSSVHIHNLGGSNGYRAITCGDRFFSECQIIVIPQIERPINSVCSFSIVGQVEGGRIFGRFVIGVGGGELRIRKGGIA